MTDEANLVEHVFCCCQAGAEAALKREVAERAPEWRFGFSRPGFVTFKLGEPVAFDQLQLPRLVFARTMGASIGRVSGTQSLAELASASWQQPMLQSLASADTPLRLHVWQRDSALPGHHGFEPGETPLAQEVREAVTGAAPPGVFDREDRAPAPRRQGFVLDVAIVEPGEWWIGGHQATSRTARWPGGVPPLSLPEHAVSRAYLKMREALAWGQPPAAKGDEWIELGCAPGGASQALLEAGMFVIGVDPAEVDPAVTEHPHFHHLNMRASDARRREFVDARWLAADINAAPSYTLDAVEPIVTHQSTSIRGLVLTLKLPNWNLAAPERMAEYAERIRSWGYRDVRARQLAFNRREFCIVALRSRSQRRMRRKRRT